MTINEDIRSILKTSSCRCRELIGAAGRLLQQLQPGGNDIRLVIQTFINLRLAKPGELLFYDFSQVSLEQNVRKNLFVKHYRNTEGKFNFRKLNDQVANKTKWATPLASKKSAPFRLSENNGRFIIFKTPLLNLMAPLIFILIGFIATITFSIVFKDKIGLYSILIGLLFGGIFIFFGVEIFWIYSDKAIFNKETGYFWRGKKQPGERGRNKPDNYCELSDIYAIQLIHENSSAVSNNRNKSKGSYEFNLVLNSGDRINLLAHGRRDYLQEDAMQLADFLNIPLWDATIG